MKENKIIKYLNSLYVKETGSFLFSKYSNDTILSTDFTVMLCNLLKIDVDSYYNSEKIKDYLLQTMNVDGLFIDRKFDSSIERYHKNDYIQLQFTYFTLIALDILGVRFQELTFMKPFLKEESLEEWFQQLNWGNFWYESNKIMFIMYFLAYLMKYGDNELQTKANEMIQVCFRILDQKQDKNTGYWGTDLNNNNLQDGCFGSSHIYLFYDYFKKEIQYPNKIVDSTILLHSTNGLINRVEGGACEDYDAIEIYYRILKQTSYRNDEIHAKIRLMKDTLDKAQNRDGGYSYRLYAGKSLFKDKKTKYKYSSWDMMETPIYHSDIWGTFFRMLTIKMVEDILSNKKDYNSYNLPGWGYFN